MRKKKPSNAITNYIYYPIKTFSLRQDGIARCPSRSRIVVPFKNPQLCEKRAIEAMPAVEVRKYSIPFLLAGSEPERVLHIRIRPAGRPFQFIVSRITRTSIKLLIYLIIKTRSVLNVRVHYYISSGGFSADVSSALNTSPPLRPFPYAPNIVTAFEIRFISASVLLRCVGD